MHTKSIFTVVPLIFVGIVMGACDQSPQKPAQNSGAASTSHGNQSAPAAAAQPSAEDLSALRSMVKSDDKPTGTAALPPGHPPIPGADSSTAASPPRQPAAGMNELNFSPPMDWKPVPPRSSMRKAQYALPRVEGDSEDGELVIFYFGPGEGGATADNIARWRGQFTQADGSPLPESAGSEEKFEAGGFRISLLDVSGRYAPGAMPGMPDPGPRNDFRMFAAVIETPHGPWFIKATGPERTMAAQREAVLEFLRSVKQ